MISIANMKLIDYETIVKKMSRENSSELIDNDTVEHAKILVPELVNSSYHSIKLYTNSFCSNFYLSDKVKEAFYSAKERNVQLEIIAETNLDDNEALEEYKNIFGNDLKLKSNYSEKLTMKLANNETIDLNNFMIIDDKGIRYEQENRENICENIKDIKARATFNRPEDVKPFVEIFNTAINIK